MFAQEIIGESDEKENIAKRVKSFEKPDFDVTTKNPSSPSKRKDKYTTVVGAEISFKPSGKYEDDYLMPNEYEDHLLREEIIKQRGGVPIFTGESMHTKSGDLSSKYLIHTVGPVWWGGNHNEEWLLR